MTRKIRGATLIALSASLVLATAACSSSDEPASDTGQSSSSETGAADTGTAEDSTSSTTTEQSSDTGTAEPSGEPVTLTLWSNATTGPGTEFFQKTITAFEAANPNITIDLQIVQNEDMDGKLQTALQGGADTAPDIFFQRGGGKMIEMVEAGQLLDITDLISEETKANVSEGVYAPDQYQGRTYAMPVTVLPGGFFYGQDVFKAAGVTTPPTTLAELNDAVTKIRATGVAPLTVGAQDGWPAGHWYYWFALRECSQEVFTSIGQTRDFTDPCWLRAAQDLADMVATKPFNDGFLTTSAQQGAGSSAGLIANHQAGAELMGAWDPGVIGSLTPDQKPLPDLGFFPFITVPGGEGDPTAIMGGVDAYSCSAYAPAAECAAFLNFLVKTDVQKDYYEAFQAPVVNTEAQAAITDPVLQQVIAGFNNAAYVSLWMDTDLGQDLGGVLNDAVVGIFAGTATPQDLIDAVNNA